jgi:hypothetical protein
MTIAITTKAFNMLHLSQGDKWADSPQTKEFRLPLKEHSRCSAKGKR